jgi:glycosyltransferase involved in cell wall biosynthesis
MYHSQAARRAAIKNGVPYYVFIHGALDPWFRRYRVKHLKKKVYWKLFEHRVLRDADAVLFTTKEEQELARNAFLPYDCRARVSGFGVGRPPGYGVMDRRPAWRAFAASHPSLNDRHYLLYLARIHEKKGLDLALRAFSATKTMLSNTALVVVGHGDERFVRNLKDLARSLGIEDDVIWTGALYNDDKWNVIRAADAYILPSHQENFGISVVESLACGVPVLISDKINIWREVVSDAAGFVGSDTLSGTIRNLEQWAVLSDHGRSEMGNNGLNCFRKHFDVDVTWKRLRSILERGRAKAAVY